MMNEQQPNITTEQHQKVDPNFYKIVLQLTEYKDAQRNNDEKKISEIQESPYWENIKKHLEQENEYTKKHIEYNIKQYIYDGLKDQKIGVMFQKTLFDDLLMYARDKGFNDVLIKENNPIRGIKDGKIYLLTKEHDLLSNSVVIQIAETVANGNVWISKTIQGGDFDSSYQVNRNYTFKIDNNSDSSRVEIKEIVQRFRVNISPCTINSKNSIEITMRIINNNFFEDKSVPDEVYNCFKLRDGINIIAGGVGKGKTTLISGLIYRLILDKSVSVRILSFEAPIEVSYDNVPQNQTVITQSEIPTNFSEFHIATRGALRRANNQVFVGESRDEETIEAGIILAETSSLVHTTIHANNVSGIILRIWQTLKQGSSSNILLIKMLNLMRLNLSQDLLLHIDGKKRIAVREYLIFNQNMSLELQEFLTKKGVESLTIKIDELVFQKGIHFQVHARFLYLDKQISEETFKSFMMSRSFSLEEENLIKLDNKIKDLQKNNHKMFIWSSDNHLPFLTHHANQSVNDSQ